VVWFEGRRVSTERLGHYMQVIGSISSLVRVPTRYETVRPGVVMMEAY